MTWLQITLFVAVSNVIAIKQFTVMYIYKSCILRSLINRVVKSDACIFIIFFFFNS